MKILYLHPRAWTGEYPVLAALRDRGHTICVLEEDRKLPAARRLAADFERPGDGIATLWFNPRRGAERLLTWPWDRYYRRAFDGRNLAHRAWLVAAAARLFKPDVMVASDGFSYAVPAAWLRRQGKLSVPLVVSYIGGDILDFPEAEVGKRRTPAVTRLIRDVIAAADLLRPVSPLVARTLIAEGAAESKLRICPSHLVADAATLDAIFAARDAIRARIRAARGIAADAPTIVTLSGNLRGKGLHLLAEAWPRVLAAIPRARWLLCGPADPWLAQAVWPRLEAAGVTASVQACGSLSGAAVFEHLAAADLHVNPSLGESLNMVTVEAAAVGTPTLGSDRAGIADWMQRHDAGIVVPAGEVGPLADAIIRALGDPQRLAGWSRAGRGMAAEFALERIAGQLESLFEEARRAPSLEH